VGCKALLWNSIKLKNIPVMLFIPAICIMVQLLIWHSETGHFFIKSYANEQFYFSNPHFLSVLFSFRKGWYVYAPIMLISTVGGLVVLFKKDVFRFFAFLFFFIPLVYIISCWWCWYYGDSYGMRVFIDFYTVFALLLAFFLSEVLVYTANARVNLVLKLALILTSVFIIALNLIQQYQYINLILSRDGMSRGRYWKIFLKTDDSYKRIFYKPLLTDLDYFDHLVYTNNFEHNTWCTKESITDKFAHGGNYSAFVDKEHTYGPTLTITTSDLPSDNNLYAHLDVWVYSKDTNSAAYLIMNTLEKDGTGDGWESVRLKTKNLRTEWEHIEVTKQLPAIKTPNDILNIFMIYGSGGPVYIDDLTIKIGRPK
jgi:hypothetical protein